MFNITLNIGSLSLFIALFPSERNFSRNLRLIVQIKIASDKNQCLSNPFPFHCRARNEFISASRNFWLMFLVVQWYWIRTITLALHSKWWKLYEHNTCACWSPCVMMNLWSWKVCNMIIENVQMKNKEIQKFHHLSF